MASARKFIGAVDLMVDDETGAIQVSDGGPSRAFVADGVTAAAAGAVAITLHATTTCRFFTFWLSTGASDVHVKTDGTAGGATSPAYYDNMGAKTIRLATPATTITVFFDGAVGNLNWIAES
ncbi:MAG: hypothetical protein IMZ55_04905 [Acidobacteria bacterium]|nr:hypothetical protein [Acidobacteriota bacterium]